MAGQLYLVDTSVYVLRGQHPRVHHRFAELMEEGRLAACQVSSLEYLNNAPDPRGYEMLWTALHGHRWLDVGTEAMDRALATHRALAKTDDHRHFRLPTLIIAATAALHGVTVLHYDTAYDRIAAVTAQPTEWIAPQGSL